MAEGLRVWEQVDAGAALARRLSGGPVRKQLTKAGSPSSASSRTVQKCTLRVRPPTISGAGGSAAPAGDVPNLATTAEPECDAFGLSSCVVDGAALDLGRSQVAGQTQGRLGQLAAAGSWRALYDHIASTDHSIFVTGRPGVGKSNFLRGFYKRLLVRWGGLREVVIVAPTRSAAMTASGQTYHSFFGFSRDYCEQLKEPVQEAAQLLDEDRFRFISRGLAQVRALLLDEVSMVAADKFDDM